MDGTGAWPPAESAALDLVDELCADNCASDETWKALTASYTEGEIIELVMLIGFYRMNAGFLNSLGVQLESGRPALGQGMAYDTHVTPVRAGAAVDETQTEAAVEGTWDLKFYHPAVTQELQFKAVLKEGTLTGSVTNAAADITIPVSDGAVRGNRVTFTTDMTKPFPATIVWDGTIDCDIISGTVDIKGVGTFPFDGERAGKA